MKLDDFSWKCLNFIGFSWISPDLTPGPDFLHAPSPPRTPGPKTHQKTMFLIKKLGFKVEFQLPWLFIPWGEFKVEVIFFPRGAPRGDPQGGVPRGGSPGGFEGAVRASHLAKKSRIRPRGYLFMLRSILILLDLEIPLKSQQITKKRIYKESIFSKFEKF